MPKHIPVLEEAVLTYLAPQRGESYLDVTAGYGGHAQRVLDVTQNYADSVLVDRDEYAIQSLQKKFDSLEVQIIHSDFVRAAEQLIAEQRTFDIVLADLGISSPHIDNAERGFSFQHDAPLDMRMDQSQELTAKKIVNSYSEKELVGILRDYGEEYRAHKIVRQILKSRPISSTKQLADIVARAVSSKRSKTHPATKTFQALRIAVNNELTQLQQALPLWEQLLSPGGRLGVISFHSLEDRIVKQYFAEKTDVYADSEGHEASIKRLTKKPVTADANEVVLNPRARSAKLRVVAKIKTERS